MGEMILSCYTVERLREYMDKLLIFASQIMAKHSIYQYSNLFFKHLKLTEDLGTIDNVYDYVHYQCKS